MMAYYGYSQSTADRKVVFSKTRWCCFWLQEITELQRSPSICVVKTRGSPFLFFSYSSVTEQNRFKALRGQREPLNTYEVKNSKVKQRK